MKFLKHLNPRVIAAGNEHTIMVDYKNDVYVWGCNHSGQLGTAHKGMN